MEENLSDTFPGGKSPCSKYKIPFACFFALRSRNLNCLKDFFPPSSTFFGYGPVVLTSIQLLPGAKLLNVNLVHF